MARLPVRSMVDKGLLPVLNPSVLGTGASYNRSAFDWSVIACRLRPIDAVLLGSLSAAGFPEDAPKFGTRDTVGINGFDGRYDILLLKDALLF